MKNLKSIAFAFITLISLQVFASNEDKIITTKGEIFSGEIVKLGNNFFKIKTSNDIIKIHNYDVEIVSFAQELSDFEKTQLGKLDGRRYAKRKGGNIVLGFLTGLIGTGLVYLSSAQQPSYEAMLGENKKYKDDPYYLDGYRKGARAKSTESALIGTLGFWALLVITSS